MKKVLYLVIIAVSLFGFSCSSKKEVISQDMVVITDVMGREVSIPVRPERIVIGDHYWETFMVGGDDVFDNVVGWSATTWVKWRNSIYKEFAKAVPRLYELVDVGLTFNQTFDIEKFLSLDPDLLILPVYQYEPLDAGIKEAITFAGVPIVLIDFSAGTKELHNRSIDILGQIFNQNERATEINSIYNKYLGIIETRLSELTEQPTVYLEKGSKGPAIFDETWGSSNWAPVLTRAGGFNISQKIIKGVGNADNEFMLTENPDFIFFTGSTWPTKTEAIQLGFNINKADTKKTAMRYVDEREGWNQLNAIQNKNVYVMHHGFIRSVLDFLPSIYIAEKIHPELFTDLNAEEIAMQFFNDYLPVDFHGSWLCSLYE
ncbi:MAG: ABC transporter substrate-binding protein [Spirochaetaceae bacterium]